MSRSNLWAMHFQKDWRARADDWRFPDWYRVQALAYGTHGPNGHAPFATGAIAVNLIRPDRKTGEMFKPDSKVVRRAISQAIELGLLDARSSSRCLVVPSHAIEMRIGNIHSKCESRHRNPNADQIRPDRVSPESGRIRSGKSPLTSTNAKPLLNLSESTKSSRKIRKVSP